MGGSSKKVTVGYKYYAGMHMVLCHGPVDYLREIRVDDKTLTSLQMGSGTYTVNHPDLFGGEGREGGVSGVFDVMNGEDTQTQNSYLVSKLGNLVPAFRGVLSVVLRQMYLGINPYLKTWSYRASRIHVRQNGIAQWYDEKAEISERILSLADSWKYKEEPPGSTANYSSPSYDDSAWLSGPGGFGNVSTGASAPGEESTPPSGTIVFGGASPVPAGCSIWIRKDIGPITRGPIYVELWHDDGPELWFNGTKLVINELSYFHSVTQVPSTLISATGPNIVACKVIDSFKNGSPSGNPTYIYAGMQMLGQQDMNPAHIIRECLTDPLWGMGYNESDIDETSFRYAADTLYDEGMGMSLLWDTEVSIEEFVALVCKHINASIYVDRRTGKFILKLIRQDYDEETLLQLNPSNVSKVQDFTRVQFGELVNAVTVSYWNAGIGDISTLTVQDIALAAMQGANIGTSIKYEGFTNANIASRVAQRDLKTLSSPLVSCTVYANTDAEPLNIGDCFKLTWPDYDLDEVVMRVTGIGYGDGKSNRVRITCSQDVYAMPDEAYIAPTPPEGIPSDAAPGPVLYRLPYEVPYLEAVQQAGQTVVDNNVATNPEIGYVGIAAIRPQSNALNAEFQLNSGAGFENQGIVDFCPSAITTVAIGKMTTSFTVSDVQDSAQIPGGSWLQIGTEIMEYVSLIAGTLTVKRGLLDTVPVEHASGSPVFFWDAYGVSDDTQYVAGESIDIKLLTATGSGVLGLLEAPTDTVELVGRMAMPYPPGNFKINAQYFPETIGGSDGLSLTWAHRDRRQQTGADYVDFTEGDIGPEAGTTYNVRIYNENNVLIHTESAISGTSFDYSTSDELDDNGGTAGDPYWSNVIFLTPFTSDFADKSSRAIATTNVGSCTIDSTDGAVGLGCLLAPVGGYIEASVDAKFGTSDFTIETYAKVSATSPAYFGIFDFEAAKLQDNGLWVITINNTAANSGLTWVSSNGTSWNIFNVKNVGAMNDNAWHHWALVRNGTSLRVYRDGVLVASATLAAGLNFTQKGTWTSIGVKDANPSSGGNQPSRYQYTRITKGVARYTANFTPPTEFPTQAPVGRLNGKVRIELESERDSIVSYQAHNHTVERLGYGFNYGDRYGN